MAHPAQADFCGKVKALFPDHFRWKRVLDCGSLDVNGSNRPLFDQCAYTGVDIGPGKNVDVVCPIHALQFPSGAFDTIVSTECFEHDMHYAHSLRNIVRLLAPMGLFFFTCATTGRAEHGTRRQDAGASPLTAAAAGWCDYYRNLTEVDVRLAMDVDATFGCYEFSVHQRSCDLYFWGIKR